MLYLLLFIFGIIFISFIVPLLDGVLSLLMTWIEAKKAKQAEIINLTNLKIKQDAASSDEIPIITGFGACLENEEEEDDDDL